MAVQSVFGSGNKNVSGQQIQDFLSNSNLTGDQILDAAKQHGVSLSQIQAAMPGDAKFEDANAERFLSSRGINRPDRTPARMAFQQPRSPLAGPEIATGLRGAEQALEGGLGGAMSALSGGLGLGLSQDKEQIEKTQREVAEQIQGGTKRFRGFSGEGNRAIRAQGALAGTHGADAQAAAIAAFQDSPGQKFMQDRAQTNLLRNSAALGGLGGGRVRSALAEQGVGFAQQDFDNNFNRLGQISGQGLSALNSQAGLTSQGAGLHAQLGGQAAQAGRLGLEAGRLGSQFAFNTGMAQAQGRTRAGEQISGNIANTGSALSKLVNQQGAALSDQIGNAGSNLASIIAGSGQAQEMNQQQVAAVLANLAAQEGTQLTNVKPLQGIAAPVMNTLGGLFQAGSALAGSSAFK